MKIALHQVDAFTNVLFGGNPAGVVSNADGLRDTDMLKIAREMNLSETAFVLRPQVPGADMSLRFFTPTSEVDFCGHATIGTLGQLAQLERFGLGKLGRNEITVHTKAETLTMAVENDTGKTKISFTAPQVQMEAYPDQGEQFAERISIRAQALSAGSIVYIDRKLRYIYVPVASHNTLEHLSFDFEHIKDSFGAEEIVVFCLYVAAHGALYARGLAPLVGVNEDPFTGSMQAGLLHAAKRNGDIPENATAIRVEQGQYIGRPGFAELHHELNTDTITVTAEAVPVFSTEMELS